MLYHPFIVVLRLLIPLMLCKVSVTDGSKKKCFLTNEELKTAVKNYVAGGKKKKAATIAKYGSPIGNWCVGKITDFSSVFADHKAFNEPLANWDTSNATKMEGMFGGAEKFNQPLNRWNVSKVTDMKYMFSSAYKFNKPVERWDVSQVTDMSGMFLGASTFNQPLDSWNVSRVTDMYAMFRGASSFNQPLNSWNVGNVKTMWGMFMDAHSFNQPLDRWNVSHVTDMEHMFHTASSFNQLLTGWNVGKVRTMVSLFDGAYQFNQPLDKWDVSQVTDMSNMFYRAYLFNQPLNSWNVSQVISMSGMFYRAYLFNQPLNRWSVGKVKNMNHMFDGASAFDQNLCSWGFLIPPDGNVDSMFHDTACFENNVPPNFGAKPPGPFCQACNTMIINTDVEETSLFAQQNVVLIFQLHETVGAGHRVTCELEVPNGDANLFINFGSIPQDKNCSCASLRFGSYDEDCTTRPATTKTSTFIAVQAAQQSSNMTLFCKINAIDCLEENHLCNTTEDCCGTNVCDGNETVAPRCVPCGKPEPSCPASYNAKCPVRNKPCTKPNTQCCRQYECSSTGVCMKK